MPAKPAPTREVEVTLALTLKISADDFASQARLDKVPASLVAAALAASIHRPELVSGYLEIGNADDGAQWYLVDILEAEAVDK